MEKNTTEQIRKFIKEDLGAEAAIVAIKTEDEAPECRIYLKKDDRVANKWLLFALAATLGSAARKLDGHLAEELAAFLKRGNELPKEEE